jgi:hypothetical protein
VIAGTLIAVDDIVDIADSDFTDLVLPDASHRSWLVIHSFEV